MKPAENAAEPAGRCGHPPSRPGARANRRCAVALLIAACLAGQAAAGDEARAIITGVEALRCSGNPAALVVWGTARPLVVGPQGRVFAAAGHAGSGRLVVLGHGSFVRDEHPDSVRFTANAIEWLAEDAATIRVHGAATPVLAELEQRGRSVRATKTTPADLAFDDVDVIVASPQAFAAADRLEELDRWLRAGGGLLLVETAWGILQLNPDLELDTLAAHQLLAGTGIRFTDGAHSGYGPDGTYPIDADLLTLANATTALRVLDGTRAGDPAMAARVTADALRRAPLDSGLIRAAQSLAHARRTELDARYARLDAQRLTPDEDALAFALLDLDARIAATAAPRDLRPHASAAAFPGPVGDPARDTEVRLDPRIPGWRTTGLYAPPGAPVTIELPEDLVDAGLVAQIGAWRDPHDHPYRVRLRTALRRYPLRAASTEVASAIGGPLYLDLPPSRDARPDAPLVIRVRGAVPAPHYRHGRTDPEDWRTEIRHRRVPWAEFESDRLVLTVPSSAVRAVEHPDRVMAHWDRVHAAMQSLEPRTANHWADRQYRYVADASVSWGYMYCPADAPIVIPLHEADEMFKLENFDAEGANELWGHYHEMGHAHQNPLWTDGATSEVTVNIFTVYALHTVNGYPLDADVMRSTPREARETFSAHRAAGRPFEEVGGPFPRLQFYALLWHEFGFDAFRETFSRIRATPADRRPKNDTAERNLFLVHFSETVGKSLVAYGRAWGLEVSDEATERLAKLPEWLPEAVDK